MWRRRATGEQAGEEGWLAGRAKERAGCQREGSGTVGTRSARELCGDWVAHAAAGDGCAGAHSEHGMPYNSPRKTMAPESLPSIDPSRLDSSKARRFRSFLTKTKRPACVPFSALARSIPFNQRWKLMVTVLVYFTHVITPQIKPCLGRGVRRDHAKTKVFVIIQNVNS